MKLIVVISLLVISCGTPGGGRYEIGSDDNAERSASEEVEKEDRQYQAHIDSMEIFFKSYDSLNRIIKLQEIRIQKFDSIIRANKVE